MRSKILFVFEGVKTEPQIEKNINKEFFAKTKDSVDIIISSYGNNLYRLYAEIAADQDLDVVELLREADPGALEGISRHDVAEIFMFFDHDAHAELKIEESNKKTKEMLDLFENETEYGKLYISYPMVESTRDFDSQYSLCSSRCVSEISMNTKYKGTSGRRSAINDYRK